MVQLSWLDLYFGQCGRTGKYVHRNCKPPALNVLQVTLAHVVPEVVFPPEDLTFVGLRADKADMAQGVIPMCHTMS